MRGAYPLLLHQNGWSVGGCRDPTALLRSVGVDLSRPAHHAHNDIEIHVEDPLSSFSHEYPQPPAATHGLWHPRKGGDPGRSASINRAVQRLQLSRHQEPEVRLETRDTRGHTTASSRSSVSTATPRGSPRTSSPRAVYSGRRQEGEVRGGSVEVELQESRSLPRGGEGSGRCRAGGGAAPGFTLPTLMGGPTPSQLSLCCSTPDVYYNEERMRQEPEPGLMNCCDAKVSCCPCCPCLQPYCPVGHMNTVCMALICSGIIVFIVLSPLFHYLIPT